MIKEHDLIVLTADLPAEKLCAGDVGTIVHIHKLGEAYEVEFMALDGETVTVTTLPASKVRPIARHEIAHARLLSA